ncbi:DHA2 family efflux MFS transporter permease subunit [Microbacterium sp. zg.Y909]|uniref:DHA2 family efflux MFS transporter permease subunit n=1 Tax=Microbacterium sp. zg.Y909 TaxID=2969413 RepID=UPI00214B6FAC|nr:DHA2 family efflux MFS transporter permease subunit [Microbacterium sp. zg.Y909]MCR2826230.1 DHA2 family efflux MFS transporter permease subunit [Microbacterium sp. zg.Y909]
MSSPVSARTRWWALAVLSLTQLVVVLDGTIVNIALPQAQAALDLTDSARQWVVTAYALAFGALLLLGGRVADYWGRKRTYMVGMVGFGIASLWGGLAQTGTELILARGLQGVFAALLAPAALALLTVTFPSGRERNTAFAVFGTVAGAGAAVGLALGGVLTEFFSWRWCLLVNLVFVVIGIVGALLFLRESKAEGDNRYDAWGAVTVTLGLGALVYGFSLAEFGWSNVSTIAFLAAGVVLLALFVWIETRARNPLLPLHVVTDRVRAGAFLIQAVAGSVMIGATLYLTFHLQIVLGMSALAAGLASLPLPLATMLTAPIVTTVLGRIGPRPLMITGPLVVAASLLLLSRITGGAYAVEVLPALIVMGFGMAFIFVPLQNLALAGVPAHDAGVASATANSAMQIGGSIGLSVFTAVYAAVVGPHGSGIPATSALVDGYSATFVAAAVGMAVAAVIAIVFVRNRRPESVATGGPAADAHR